MWGALRRLGGGVLIVLLAVSGGAFAALKTEVLLSDLKPEVLGTEAEADRILKALPKEHGNPARWRALPRVHMELRGRVLLAPVRYVFGMSEVDVELSMSFVPQRHGRYHAEIRQRSGARTGAFDTRTDRNGAGFMLDSVRHLFELPVSAEQLPIRRSMAPSSIDGVVHQRIFASFNRIEADPQADQLVLWIREGRLVRFDTTGRDIAPFIKARVEYEGRYALEEISLPKFARVYRWAKGGSLVHEWELVRAWVER